jgi:hypothetical protein
MSSYKLTVPVDDTIEILDDNDNVLCKASLIEIDLFLAEAQKVSLDDDSVHGRLAWLDEFIRLFEDRYGVKLNPTAAFMVVTHTTEILNQLKKSYAYSPTLSESTT